MEKNTMAGEGSGSERSGSERFLVTGALGCIGAWVVRNLVQEHVPVTVFDVSVDSHRMKLIMTPEQMEGVQFMQGDITDLAAVEAVISDSGASHIVHLAALQVPFCRADPPLGARVNVVGTVNMFEAARRAGLRRLVYASSVAVFGRDEDGGSEPESVLPSTLYGVYKQANEGTARLYWQDHGLSSIGLRPHTVYGPGRDQGMTSSPTKAMLAAAAGVSFHIPFGGRGDYQYADDTAKLFLRAARAPLDGAEVFNLRGSRVDVAEIVAAIHAVEPGAPITHDDQPLAVPEALDDAPLRAALGAPPVTPLLEGVSQTIAIFRQALIDGRIRAAF
jgi:nucleoside-diphosphate-sugar epimerase